MKHRRVVVVLQLVLAFGLAAASADDCLDTVGRFPFGETQAVATQGDLVFMGDGAAVVVIDLSAPSSPVVLGSIGLPYRISGIAVDGDRVYAVTVNHLHVIDVSNPAWPVELGALAWFGGKHQLSASGDLVCFAEISSIVIVDVSNPTAPAAVGEWTTGVSEETDVELAGSLAYVTAGGLRVLDLADPANPAQVGFYGAPTGNLDIAGDLLFVESGQLTILDVSEPTLPTFVGQVNVTGSTTDVAVHGDLAFVSTQIDGLHVVDVSSPDSPTVMGTAPFPSTHAYEKWLAVAAVAGHGLVATVDHGMRVIAATEPTAPTQVAHLDSMAWPEGIATAGDLVFIAAQDRGVRIVDVSDPAVPVNSAIFDGAGYVWDVDAAGSYAYTVGSTFTVIDASDPDLPTILGELPIFCGEGVAVVDQFAYLACHMYGLRIIDVSIPGAPYEIGSVDLGNDDWSSIDVQGTIAAVRSGSTIAVVDVGDPANPVSRSTIAGGWSPSEPVLQGRWLLFAQGGTLYTFDLGDPDNPIEANAVFEPRVITALGVYGSVAYLGTQTNAGESGIEVWDVGNPVSPVLMSELTDTGWIFDFDGNTDHLITSQYSGGFNVLALCHDPLFGDDFETGGTGEWSGAVP
jgi:hypothetical protein